MIQSHAVKIDRNGRLLLPKSIRSQLGIEPGMVLELKTGESNEITLRIVPDTAELIEKDGLWVVRGEINSDLGAWVNDEREARFAEIANTI